KHKKWPHSMVSQRRKGVATDEDWENTRVKGIQLKDQNKESVQFSELRISAGGRSWPAAGSTPVRNLLPGCVYKELQDDHPVPDGPTLLAEVTSPLQDHPCSFPADWWLPETLFTAVICQRLLDSDLPCLPALHPLLKFQLGSFPPSTGTELPPGSQPLPQSFPSECVIP
ncbi:hypothetical protein CRENBAI_012698, partial [Crenichthys baileyi]